MDVSHETFVHDLRPRLVQHLGHLGTVSDRVERRTRIQYPHRRIKESSAR